MPIEPTHADWLRMLRQRGSQPGLERITRALNRLGNPQNRLRVLHIAGTNGKGSTAYLLQHVLTAAGYRTGCYTSPAVLSLTEGITIDGVALEEAAFWDLSQHLSDLLGQDADGLTEFEWTTIVALLWFARQHVDFAVIECGMGGGKDATNVFPSPLATIFTPIALDHTAFLGNTIEAIALEKSGILREHGAVISAPHQDVAALGVLMEQAARLGLTVHIGSTVKDVHFTCGGLSFSRGDTVYRVESIQQEQAENAMTVLEAVEVLRDKGVYLEQQAVVRGIESTRFPARQEWIAGDPPIVLDSAHNPHGIAALARTMKRQFGSQRPILLLGMLRDKDTATCVRLLSPLCADVVCCTPDNPRALTAEELARQFDRPVFAEARQAQAFVKAYALAKEQGRPLVVGGSFYVSLPLRAQAFEAVCSKPNA